MTQAVANRRSRRVKRGQVISNKMQKTLVVRVSSVQPHPRYGKIVKRSKKLYVHCDLENVQVGDDVTVMETRPLSKTKRWRVVHNHTNALASEANESNE